MPSIILSENHEPDPRIAEKREVMLRHLKLLLAVNVAFAALILFWWQNVSWILDEPVRWSTWSMTGKSPAPFDYPFVLLWGAPAMCSGVAWILRSGDSLRLALIIAVFPLCYIGLLMACFHIVPMLLA